MRVVYTQDMDHRYRGHRICRSSYVQSRRWYVQVFHHTGMAWSEECCPQFDTLAQAREWIDTVAQ